MIAKDKISKNTTCKPNSNYKKINLKTIQLQTKPIKSEVSYKTLECPIFTSVIIRPKDSKIPP